MLKSISCEKLIDSPLVFKKGLNAVVGADDAQNSIGKSSVLMLIDFAYGGSDFPKKCDDVLNNVGELEVISEFIFDKSYRFLRNTSSPDLVYSYAEERVLSLRDFNYFLTEKYLPPGSEISFRDCVSGFFRIYQRNNYDHKRPLDIIPREAWENIRKRLLKMFNVYWVVSALEQKKAVAQKVQKDIAGTFSSGAVKKITKVQAKKNTGILHELSADIDSIKKALNKNVTDIRSVLSKESLRLKKEKDGLVELRLDLMTQLSRVEDNLSNSKLKKGKNFQSVKAFFPDVSLQKLFEVESFHAGITEILKEQLKGEQASLLEAISIANSDIAMVDDALLSMVNSKEESVYLLERLIELDRQKNDLVQQQKYLELSDAAKGEVKDLKLEIETALINSVAEIETKLNDSVMTIVSEIYGEQAIAPVLAMYETNYKFDHGDDRGTGKGFANMIALDLSFLKETILPALIHDSLLFKNMDTPAIENLIRAYDGFSKQIFISIDEIPKYRADVVKIVENSMFLKLDKNRMAFKLKWKTKA